MTTHDEQPKKAKTTTLKQKEKTTMKTKLTKMIMSYLAFAGAAVCLSVTMAPRTSATARAAADGGRVCSVHLLKGVYLASCSAYRNLGGNFVPRAVPQGIQ